MRHRKVGLSTWIEIPNGMWILSHGGWELCCHLPQEGICWQLQFHTTSMHARGTEGGEAEGRLREGTLSMLHPDSCGSLSPFLCTPLLASLCFYPLLDFRLFKQRFTSPRQDWMLGKNRKYFPGLPNGSWSQVPIANHINVAFSITLSIKWLHQEPQYLPQQKPSTHTLFLTLSY